MTNKGFLLAWQYKDEVGDIGFLARSFLDACTALKEISRFNRINCSEWERDDDDTP